MSFTTLCLSVLALSPELAATLISGLLAAVPVVAGETDPQVRQATLIREMNELHPRDLEEAILASQVLAAHHNAQACSTALAGLDPASKEASRLRRDVVAMQRLVLATQRAFHQSQARPMQQDAEGGDPRPMVPARQANPPRGRAAAKEIPPMPAGAAAAEQPGAAVAAGARPKFDPFKADPSLARLRERWNTVGCWEDMTMEERRETFGYSYTPKGKTAASGSTEVPRPAA
ncbi:MAG TPA: hypothetical protein VFN42_01995 [Acetobacteraceae bacterium]|nr:hypothetical protein [Acetobacteraceae bacterium]